MKNSSFVETSVYKVSKIIYQYSYNGSEINATNADSLYILISENGLVYAITDIHKNCLLLKEYIKNADQSIHNLMSEVLDEIVLKYHFKTVIAGITNNRLSIVPENLFRPDSTRSYLENIVPVWNNDHIEYFRFKNQSARLVYAFDKNLISNLIYAWPGITLYHSIACYISVINTILPSLEGAQHVFVNAMEANIYIAIFQNNELIFANAYEFHTPEDFLYHIMLHYQEFKLDPLIVPLHFTGKITIGSKLMNTILRYVKNIDFISNTWNGIASLNEVPDHVYFDLFALGACES
jgi:hypothetical protein